MQRTFLIIWLLTSAAMQGEILDRILATVNNHIVLLSDVKRERAIRAVLGENELKDDKAVLQELIDAQIVDEQVSQFPGIDVGEADVQLQMDGISDLHGIPVARVRSAVERRLRTSAFFDLRFRQFLRATDDEVLKYYETIFVPEAAKRGLNPVPAMEAVAGQIRNNIIEEKTTSEIDDWLTALRKRSSIEIFE